jgi:dTMP kinase
MLIVVDGIDGSGKETQIRLLSKFLRSRGKKVAIHKYPTANARSLHEHLNNQRNVGARALFMLFAADIMVEQEKVEKELKQGKVVVLDRYVTSTLAYQGEKLQMEQGKRIVEVSGFLEPDLVILLDLPPRLSAQRKMRQKKLDRFESDTAFLGRVRNRYLKLMHSKFLTSHWKKVDASRSIEEIAGKIKKEVGHLL